MTAESAPRSYLYVPGNAHEKIAKAFTRGADALILDLEDAVPLAEKDAAREWAAAWLRQPIDRGDVELWVRTNSGPGRREDVAALAGIPSLTGLILAKVEDAAEIASVAAHLTRLGDVDTLLMPMIETSAALLDSRELAVQPRVHLLQLGEIDLAGEMGIIPGEDEEELAAVRTLVVLASASTGLGSPIGPVSRNTRDLVAFARSTERVRRQGFMGRACIHPAQVEVVNRVFTPSTEEVAEARAVIAMAQKVVTGGVVLDDVGRLVDAAVLRSARRVLDLAERSAP